MNANHLRYGGGGEDRQLCWACLAQCHSACTEHSRQKLLPVVKPRLWNKVNRSRVVTESEKTDFMRQSMCYLSYGAHEPVYSVLIVELVPHAVIRQWGQFNMIIMWLLGPIRAWLTFCSYSRVSVSASPMLIAATGRCQCLKIWIPEFAMLKQSQLQHSWRSLPLHIYETT